MWRQRAKVREPNEGYDRRVALERYSLVLLRRGPKAAEFSDEELERLQGAHLGHLRAMRDAGHLLVAGPFGDQPDETLRGICLYRTSLEETRALAEGDPSVQAGRMRVEVLSWYVPEGEIQFSAAS
jgi:uncharacterized protein